MKPAGMMSMAHRLKTISQELTDFCFELVTLAQQQEQEQGLSDLEKEAVDHLKGKTSKHWPRANHYMTPEILAVKEQIARHDLTQAEFSRLVQDHFPGYKSDTVKHHLRADRPVTAKRLRMLQKVAQTLKLPKTKKTKREAKFVTETVVALRKRIADNDVAVAGLMPYIREMDKSFPKNMLYHYLDATSRLPNERAQVVNKAITQYVKARGKNDA